MMFVPALNVSSRTILTSAAPWLAALILAAGLTAGAFAIAERPAEEARAERPVFARRMRTLPPVVVTAPADRAGEVVVRIR